MAAVARVLDQAVASRHGLDAVAEQPAEIPDLFLEVLLVPVRVLPVAKHQRVSALDTDVFTRSVAIGERLVLVMAQEARERVPHAGDAAGTAQVGLAASAGPLPVLAASR